MGTTKNDTERNREQEQGSWKDGSNWSRPPACEVVGKKLLVRNRAVKWWDEGGKEPVRVKRESHAR